MAVNRHGQPVDADRNQSRGRRRRRKKTPRAEKSAAVEPVLIAARRPGSPRLEKVTRRMKAASAKPKSAGDGSTAIGDSNAQTPRATGESLEETSPKPKREVRIIQRKADELDDREKTRLRLLAQYLASEGRVAITKAADTYLAAGFELPLEQDVQVKLLEHISEERALGAIVALRELIRQEVPRKLPVFRQRLRRLEEHADDPTTREAAKELLKQLPAG